MRPLRILIVLLLITSVVRAQTRQLTGSVKDAKSATALPFATIKVKGKNMQALTGTDGDFGIFDFSNLCMGKVLFPHTARVCTIFLGIAFNTVRSLTLILFNTN